MQIPETRDVRVIFQPMNRVLTVPEDTPLFAAIGMAGIAIEGICGGKGTCGKCPGHINDRNLLGRTEDRDGLPAHAEGAG